MGSEVQLGPQFKRPRTDVDGAAAGIGPHMVGLELEVAAHVPVGAHGPVAFAATGDAVAVQVDMAVAGQQFDRAGLAFRPGVGDLPPL
jgi:hypothetical protein